MKMERFNSINKLFIFDKIEKEDDSDYNPDLPNGYYFLLRPEIFEQRAIIDIFKKDFYPYEAEYFSLDELKDLVQTLEALKNENLNFLAP